MVWIATTFFLLGFIICALLFTLFYNKINRYFVRGHKEDYNDRYKKKYTLNDEKLSIKEISDKYNIPCSTIFNWTQKSDNDDLTKYYNDYKKINHYKNVAKFTINGKEYENICGTARKLGLKQSVLRRWISDRVVDEKIKYYKIDLSNLDKDDVDIKDVKKVDVKESKAVVDKGNSAQAYSHRRFKINSSIPPHYLTKFNLKVGDTFADAKNFVDYIGSTMGQFYSWKGHGYFDFIN